MVAAKTWQPGRIESVGHVSLIRRVTPVMADKYLFVEVETQDGRVGVGEASAWSQIEATAACLAKYADYLTGLDAETIERHWDVLRSFGGYVGPVTMAALSAIDVALWDLKGQRLGEPVHALLGGPYRERVLVYGQALGRTQAQLVAHCAALKAAGFKAVGHVCPFLDDGGARAAEPVTVARLRQGLAVLEAVRDVLGPDTDLAVEIHRRLRAADAILFGRMIEHLTPLFYEDPVRPDSSDAMARVQHGVAIPVATGERFFALEQFHRVLETGGARFLRPCLGLCGGFTGGRRVAALAAAFDVELIPHNTYSPVATAASIHFAMATPNVRIVEFPTTRYTDDVASTALVARELTTTAPAFADGYASIADLPGLGTAPIDAITRRFPYRPIPVGPPRGPDGAPVNY